MLSPVSEAELAEMVADASAPLRVVGGGTRSLGGSAAGEVLSIAAMSGVELYEPGALTLVVKAGTPLSEVEAMLAKEGQGLPFEPPHLAAVMGRDGASTIGGVVAANASGPRRFQAGACRDALLGVRFVDGSGTVLKNGGRVMKNVTGYDLVKLMAGSWGTLGVLSEVAFKVLPRLGSGSLAVRVSSDAAALDAMTKAVTSPFDLTGAAYVPGEAVYLRVEGLEASVAYRLDQLATLIGGEIERIDDPAASAALWARLRDVSDFVEGTAALWRVSLLPSHMIDLLQSLGETGIAFEHRLDWAGGLAWLRLSDGAEVEAFHAHLQDQCRKTGGHATLVKAADTVMQRVSAFQPEAPGLAKLSAGLRANFDPRGILNPGLMGA